jgi:geranylgeranyl diphosphate synthase type II
MDLSAYLKQQVERVNAALDRWTPPEQESPETIHRAMRYSLFAGGKRIRPVLAIAACDAVRPDAPGVEDAACALEMIHTYSLIHDDLPALDNDDLRRGRPTNHKVFGEAMAILAGDSLLTLAFQVLARMPHCPPSRKASIIDELATASGTISGMIGGQVHDLEGEGKQPTPALLEAIHRAKTGALLRASVRIGALYGDASAEEYAALGKYGEHVGLAFQIVDDILDVEQPSEKLGKTAGKDAAQKKITFPAVFGIDRSREMARAELESALSCVTRFGERGRWLASLARLVVERSS